MFSVEPPGLSAEDEASLALVRLRLDCEEAYDQVRYWRLRAGAGCPT